MNKTKTYLASTLMIIFSLLIILLVEIGDNNISGYFTLIDAAPEGFVFEEPQDEPNAKSALFALRDAEEVIRSMEEKNLTTTFSKDVLYEAEGSYDDGDYLNVLKLSQLIFFVRKEKLIFLDRIELTKRKSAQLQGDRIDVSKGSATIQEAITAFEADQLDEARTLLKRADKELDQAKREYSRIENLALLGKSFVVRYWWQILIVLILIGLSSRPIFRKVRKRKISNKLIRLKEELNKTKDMIKRVQKSCFVEKKITPSTYKSKVARYEEKIAEIKHTIPVLEAQLSGKKLEKKKTKGVIEVKK